MTRSLPAILHNPLGRACGCIALAGAVGHPEVGCYGGFADRQIAQQLSVSERTAHDHVEHIFDKLGVSTRAAAAFFAMQHDLVGPQTG